MILKRSQAPGTVKPGVVLDGGVKMFLPIAFLCFSVMGCNYCKAPVHQPEAVCQVEAVLQQCGAPAIGNLVMSVLGQVIVALSSADYQNLLAAVESDLKSQGVNDAGQVVTCAVQYVQALNAPPPNASALKTSSAQAVRERCQLWLKSRGKKPEPSAPSPPSTPAPKKDAPVKK
jgi:hypothetical protein